MNILITSGGTEEAIDGVRCITNSSTGRTGAAIAGYFSERGADVLLLRAEKAAGAPQGVTERRYRSYADLAAALKKILGAEKWDAVIHLAAVSDYTVAAVEVDGNPFSPGGPGKIAGGRDVKITLKPTAKILDSLRSWSSNPGLVVVGFKLTDGASPGRTGRRGCGHLSPERGGLCRTQRLSRYERKTASRNPPESRRYSETSGNQ